MDERDCEPTFDGEIVKLSFFIIIRDYVRHKLEWWNGYVKAYSGQLDWPLILLLRTPLFISTAEIACRQMARGRVLDIGTGPGKLPVILAQNAASLECVGIDIGQIVLQDARDHASRSRVESRVSFVCSDVQELPFANNSFDMVISMFSLHLWNNRQRAVTEIYRVLISGGSVLLLVGRQLIYPGKIRIFDYFTKSSARYLKGMFKDAGFIDIVLDYVENGALRVRCRK